MTVRMTPAYNTILFTQIYNEVETFIEDYKTNGLPTTITDESATTLFYLLFARYGNNPIANLDITQFKYKLFATVFQYGPTWEKRLDIQSKLRNLSEADLLAGSKAIYNHAYNPSTQPGTSSLEELSYINDQNTTNYKRNKLEAYTVLMGVLETDVSEEFINKFQPLFKQFVEDERPLLFITEEDDENENLEV